MKKEAEGVVIEVSGNIAKVKVNRHGECKNCGACPGDNAAVLEVQNKIRAKPGQRVVLEIRETNMLKAAFIVYILPLISILVGCVIGTLLSEKIHQSKITYQIGGGIVAFIISVIYIKVFDKNTGKNEKIKPIIIRIIS
ncbi:SoxR reducing system RseC family protein [Clostridium sp. DJ247]|uniref:SoxR reducing system RseC family protein n=1 Tax=Clostridium sp. DJ247 TaxID=2726188 RepID=UPI0016288132|nr:SoxR reducing system RseC family protein [Clostridium sp. DJ247]MBC2580352.1 SoxR reducing system RseC family protein [Clostridium sp. DJ247]